MYNYRNRTSYVILHFEHTCYLYRSVHLFPRFNFRESKIYYERIDTIVHSMIAT